MIIQHILPFAPQGRQTAMLENDTLPWLLFKTAFVL